MAAMDAPIEISIQVSKAKKFSASLCVVDGLVVSVSASNFIPAGMASLLIRAPLDVEGTYETIMAPVSLVTPESARLKDPDQRDPSFAEDAGLSATSEAPLCYVPNGGLKYDTKKHSGKKRDRRKRALDKALAREKPAPRLLSVQCTSGYSLERNRHGAPLVEVINVVGIESNADLAARLDREECTRVEAARDTAVMKKREHEGDTDPEKGSCGNGFGHGAVKEGDQRKLPSAAADKVLRHEVFARWLVVTYGVEALSKVLEGKPPQRTCRGLCSHSEI